MSVIPSQTAVVFLPSGKSALGGGDAAHEPPLAGLSFPYYSLQGPTEEKLV